MKKYLGLTKNSHCAESHELIFLKVSQGTYYAFSMKKHFICNEIKILIRNRHIQRVHSHKILSVQLVLVPGH
jgi:hypothetical protein